MKHVHEETTLNIRLPRERRADLVRGMKMFAWTYLGAMFGIFTAVGVLYLIGWDQ